MVDDASKREHAFATMNAKIDPNRVIGSIKENIHVNEFKEVTVMDSSQASDFTPMQWPLFDDGKPVSTNAMGYEIGGYFKRHQEAMRLAKLEAEREQEAQRLIEERQAAQQQAVAAQPVAEISPEELESIRNAARKEGYTEGLNQGHQEGYEKGVELGRSEGFEHGQQEGIERGYQDGFRQGRDEGFAKGREAGIASGTDLVTSQADRFRHLADMLANPLREVDKQVTDEIVYIISRLAAVIIRRECKQDPEFLKQSIEKAMTLLPESGKGATISLSDEDYALMLAVIGKDYMQQQNWSVKSDESLEPGDISVDTRVSSVQWRLNDRIDALLNEFLINSADAVTAAGREVIEGAPDYDEVPKAPLAPRPDLFDLKERIAQGRSEMEISEMPARTAVSAPSATALGSSDILEGPDIDAGEIAAAQGMADRSGDLYSNSAGGSPIGIDPDADDVQQL